MTTPEAPGDDKVPRAGAGAADGRIRRPEPARSGPHRASAGTAAKPAAAERPGAKLPPETAGQSVSEAVARAVKVGYDVIEKNIRQGREAAEHFRQGQYSLGDAPADIEVATLRLLHLARELSTTTFDVCERLVKELGGQTQARSAAMEAPPPFRDPGDFPSAAKVKAPSGPARTAAEGLPAASAKAPSAPAPTAIEPMRITVLFPGGKGIAHTASLVRPRSPTEPGHISAAPLAPAKAGGEPIAGVSFHADTAADALIVVVSVPEGHAPGVYSGLVHAAEDPVPLGVLTIEIPK